MRVVITGGSSSLRQGHALSTHISECFPDHEIVLLNRSTGYDFYKNYEDIVHEARKADLFINCACVGNFQIKLLEDVYDYVPNMLVLGSISGDFHRVLNDEYAIVKFNLKKRCKLLPLERKTNKTNLLHITLTEVEELANNKEGITVSQLRNIIDFWLQNPVMTNIDIKFFIGEHFLTGEKLEKVNRVVEFYARN